MNTRTWQILGAISAVALLAMVGLLAFIAFFPRSAPQTVYPGPGAMGWNDGGMMGGYGGMMGFGPVGGHGMMGPGFNPQPDVEPLSVEAAREAVEQYLVRRGDSELAVGEVMVFTNHAYAQVVEKSTGMGAFEVLVDPVTQAVSPEPGPNMMWNLKYGSMMGMSGFGVMGMPGDYGMGRGPMGMNGVAPSEVMADMPVGLEDAVQTAQRYLDAYLPGTQVEDHADTFYGYYTIHILRSGETVGMLSVNGYSKEVFPHMWHGDFVAMQEEAAAADVPPDLTSFGTVWVANNGSNDVSVIEAATGQLVARIPVGKVPHNVTVGQTLAYVPNSGDNSVTLVDLYTYQPIAVVPVGTAPHDVALSPDEALAFVTNTGSSSVSVIDVLNRRVVATLDVGAGPAHARASMDGRLVFVASSGSGSISIVETDALKVVDTIPTGAGTHNVVVTPDGNAAIVTLINGNGVARLDLESKRVSEVLPTGVAPHNLALSRDGAKLYVANTGATTVTVVDVHRWTRLGDIEVSRDAHGILLDAAEERAFVSNRGSGTMSVMDLASGEVLDVISVGQGPDGLVRGPGVPTGVNLEVMADSQVTASPLTGDHLDDGHGH